MPTIGAAFNIIASAAVSFFLVYWIVLMFKHNEKAKN